MDSFRVLIGRAATQYKNQQQRGYSNANRQRRDGELNVDYVPLKKNLKERVLVPHMESTLILKK
ncbi:hypothetical protein [Mangrovivirga cuniculi]|uniref:Uncharacterized protein n=1 Tax=Mangrovivirga cuniculi TaxID=2715131 RepID=A0A4D7JMA6_9BACT|nr:hypothetical protein [Mangrovivirga cuniculi]QCK16969.1 hypothetical protein DCC35_20670 [Mangrovivirga cuniculi]